MMLAALRGALRDRPRATLELATHRRAAVLVPIVQRVDDLGLVFTLRTADLRSHSGQISFPGGKRDPGDADDVATALREAEEELGIPRAAVDVLGTLDDVATPSGYVIAPVVGLLEPPPAAYRPNPVEVAEAFEVPLRRLADPAVFEAQGAIAHGGVSYELYVYRPDGRNIWGATARMVRQLLRLL